MIGHLVRTVENLQMIYFPYVLIVCSFAGTSLFGVHNDWANLVDMASVKGLNLLAVQPNGMEARLMGTHFKT
jgi:hypothetical protein